MPKPSPWTQKPEPPRRDKPFWPWLLAVVVGLGILVLYLTSSYPEVMAGEGSQGYLVYNLIWLAVIGSSLAVRWRARPGLAIRHAAIWVAIGAGLVLVASFSDEGRALKDRFVGALLPHKPIAGAGDGSVSFRKSEGGHFIVEALVEGVDIRFLVDTGATDVTLSPADARRLGFNLETLEFNQPYRTANGIGMGASIRLREIRMGPIVMTDVRASVNSAEMDRSLLGMSFLGRLSAFEFSGDRLVLKP